MLIRARGWPPQHTFDEMLRAVQMRREGKTMWEVIRETGITMGGIQKLHRLHVNKY